MTVRPGGSAAIDSGHYHVTFDRAQFTDDDVKAIVERAGDGVRESRGRGRAALPTGSRSSCSSIRTRRQNKTARAFPTRRTRFPADREIHAVRGYALAPSPREEIHVLARALYGPCYLTAIYEGLALSQETTLRGQDPEALAAKLRAAGRLPTIADLLDEERFRALPTGIGCGRLGRLHAVAAADLRPRRREEDVRLERRPDPRRSPRPWERRRRRSRPPSAHVLDAKRRRAQERDRLPERGSGSTAQARGRAIGPA